MPPGAPPGTTPRPEYGLARPLAERERAKAAELTAAGVPVSARTVRLNAARPPPATGQRSEALAAARPRPAGHAAPRRRGNRQLLRPAAVRCQRWLGTSDEPADAGIATVPEILTAYRRFQRLRLNGTDPETAADCIQAAWNITRV